MAISGSPHVSNVDLLILECEDGPAPIAIDDVVWLRELCDVQLCSDSTLTNCVTSGLSFFSTDLAGRNWTLQPLDFLISTSFSEGAGMRTCSMPKRDSSRLHVVAESKRLEHSAAAFPHEDVP